MRKFELTVNEQLFNLIWRALSERDAELQSSIEMAGEGSDEAALIGNDLAYLRLAKKELKEKAEKASFSSGAFSIEDDFNDLSDL